MYDCLLTTEVDGARGRLLGPELYLNRRKRAVELWRQVPRQVWNMARWECGSKACALGWLARERFDGWSTGGLHLPIAPNGMDGYVGAADYFGITVSQAYAVFGGQRTTARYHNRWFVSRITANDVADALLSLPLSKSAARAIEGRRKYTAGAVRV